MCLKSILKIKNGTDYKKVENKKGKYGVYGTGGLITHTDNFLIDKPTVCIGRKGTINRPMFFNTPIWTVDTLFYSDIKNADPRFVFYLFQTINWNKYNQSTGVPSLTSEGIEKINSFIPNSITEEKRISSFLSLIDKRINILSNKISILKKYKEGLISRGLKLIIGNNKFVKFKSLFEEYNVKNEEDFLPYTVGKYGLKQIQDFNYSISNHKVFKPNSLLIGLGIEEIAFSTKTTGSVSPVYNVYSLKSCCDDSFVDIFLKPLLWIKKAFITKKSTRREFEIDKKALENMKIPYLNSNEIKYLCYSIKKVDKLIETLMDKKDKLDLCKKYLLEAMFI